MKKNLKPFDLEAAKAGAKVVTRDGKEVRIICFDALSDYPIIALVKINTLENVTNYTLEGKYQYVDEPTRYDLFMAYNEFHLRAGCTPSILKEIKPLDADISEFVSVNFWDLV